MQLNHHRLVRGLQSLLGSSRVRDDLQQLTAAPFILILQELAALGSQGGQTQLVALLVGLNLVRERIAASAGKLQNFRRFFRVGNHRRQMSQRGSASLHSRGDQLLCFTSDGTRACLGRFYTVITNETGHQTAARRESACSRHAHPVTGNSVPQLSPPFRGRRPCRRQRCWYADSGGNCAQAAARAIPLSSSLQNYVHPEDPLRS